MVPMRLITIKTFNGMLWCSALLQYDGSSFTCTSLRRCDLNSLMRLAKAQPCNQTTHIHRPCFSESDDYHPIAQSQSKLLVCSLLFHLRCDESPLEYSQLRLIAIATSSCMFRFSTLTLMRWFTVHICKYVYIVLHIYLPLCFLLTL